MKTKTTLFVLLTAFLFILSACGADEENKSSQDYEGSLDIEVQDFTATNQDNKEMNLEDLKGTFWVADFIYTQCPDVCLTMTPNMAKLQNMVNDEGLDTRFVSFSVDPSVDTPEILKKYGQNYDADFSTWDFLTGYSQKDIESFAADSFKTLVSKVDDQVTHGTSFYLVAPNGHVINKYNGLKPEGVENLVSDMKRYQNQ
ncbi:protein SCO1/2 [Salinibacillus kushneri]|uniref:Protein SCO1/2 n=1 Tax=Salinibacillus kushneri TaxID=237682 RepID=A0A1I0I8P3_9BACI|nr:SCO family protein [Salinibacillus kushneri]SET92747.1 protein SCO1/2 [Salinibacillus kushneri]